MIKPKQYYTIKEIIELGRNDKFPYVSSNMIRKLIKDGHIKAIRSGISPRDPIVVKGESIIEFLENNEYFREFYLSGAEKLSTGKSLTSQK